MQSDHGWGALRYQEMAYRRHGHFDRADALRDAIDRRDRVRARAVLGKYDPALQQPDAPAIEWADRRGFGWSYQWARCGS